MGAIEDGEVAAPQAGVFEFVQKIAHHPGQFFAFLTATLHDDCVFRFAHRADLLVEQQLARRHDALGRLENGARATTVDVQQDWLDDVEILDESTDHPRIRTAPRKD
jgi:hypothetical protein